MSFCFRFIMFLFFLFACSYCSHYSPVSLGQGKPSTQEIESCTSVILIFPTEAQSVRLDTILRNNNLTPADIASVETRIWPYLFPIYANYCTVVVLNQEARAKGLVTDPIPNSDAKYEIYRSQKVEAFRIGNKTIESLKDCDRVHPLDFKKCQETVRRKLNLK